MTGLHIFIFLIGLSAGSFINVIVARLDRKEGILTGRSECPKCSHILSWRDLAPVLSFIFLRGKCRYCDNRISWTYPVVELITALTLVSYFLIRGFVIDSLLIYHFIAVLLFLLLVFFDVKYFILPDKITFTIVGLALGFNLFFRSGDFLEFLLFGFLLSLIFGILYIVSDGRWMGFGDVKLLFAIGLVLGYPLGLLVLILSVWSAASAGVIMIMLKRANLKTPLPFGAFLSVVSVVVIILYNQLQYITRYFI